MKRTSTVVRMTEAGFTLVELMIVVAIIGILAAIAIPNFQKYQAKARQKEAQLQLSGIYTAEMSNKGEQSTFTGCLANAGFTPEGDRRFYSVGFAAVAAGSGTCRDSAGDRSCDSAATVGVVPGGTATKCTFNGGAAADAVDLAFQAAFSTYNAFPASLKAGQAVPGDIGTSKIPGAVAAAAATDLTADTFIAGAIGNVNNSVNVDSWTIDNNKVFLNTVNGI